MADYEQRAFRRFLYLHTRLLSPVLQKLDPNLFVDDFQLVRRLGDSTDIGAAVSILVNFRDRNVRNGSFCRSSLKLCISPRKAGRVARDLFWNQFKNSNSVIRGMS